MLDPCIAQFDGSAARVQLPKTGIYSDGYWVFGRVRAKPNNASEPGAPSNIILLPDPMLRICNDAGETDVTNSGIAPDSVVHESESGAVEPATGLRALLLRPQPS